MTRELIIWKFSIPPRPQLRAKDTVWITNHPEIRIEKGKFYEIIGINNAHRIYVNLPWNDYDEEDFAHGGWHMLHFEQVY